MAMVEEMSPSATSCTCLSRSQLPANAVQVLPPGSGSGAGTALAADGSIVSINYGDSINYGVSSTENLTSTKKSEEKANQGSPRPLIYKLLVACATLSTISAVVVIIYWTGQQEAPLDYALVFDAGSTHTEMVVYKWHADKFKGTGVVTQVTSCDMDGGISERLRANPAATTSAYLRDCLTRGVASVPVERRSHSPLYLAATAGMRMVESESTQEADHIMGNVSNFLESSGLLFGAGSVRIITGQEEAVAGWISANYLLRTIFPKPTKRVGVLDLGGASTQIAFAQPAVRSEFDISLSLYGARHQLYARSYMCFGLAQVFNRYLVQLVKDHLPYDRDSSAWEDRDKLRVQSPCHNAGYNTTIRFEEYINGCSKTAFSDQLRNVTLTIAGSSAPEKCGEQVRALLSTRECEDNFQSQMRHSCFSAPAAHSKDTSFVAVSGFYYTMQNLGFNRQTPTVADFKQAVQRRCNVTWEDILSNESETKYSPILCFNAQYVSQLLFEEYGIQETTWRNVNFLKKVNGTSVGWTLGFTIRNTNALPEEDRKAPFSEAVFIPLIFVLAMCIGVCTTLAVNVTVNYCKNNRINVK